MSLRYFELITCCIICHMLLLICQRSVRNITDKVGGLKMVDVIISVAVTVVIYVCGYLFLRKKSLFGTNEKAFLKRACITGAVNILLEAVCILWIFIFSTPKETSVIFPFIAVAALTFAGFAAAPFLEKKNLRKVISGCAVLCIIPLLLEIFIFNAKSFDLQHKEYIPYTVTTETPGTVQISQNNIFLTGNGNIIINIEQTDLGAVQMDFSGNGGSFKCAASMKDENYETKFITVGETYYSTDYGHGSFSFEPYKTLKSFKIDFSDVSGTLTVSNLKFSSALPFEFSNLRFFSLSAVLIIIYLIYSLKLYKVIYNEKSFKQKCVIAAAVFICVLSAFVFLTPDNSIINYETVNIATADPYVQMFDAVNKGQVNIDIPVSEEFKNMENPYDWQQRIDSGVSYAWDRAYFEGNYYSYFGIVPVFLLYFPFYFITGYLPSLNINIFVFSVFSIVFLMMTILTLVKIFIKRPNFLLLVGGLVSSVFCSGIYYALDFSDIYFPAKVSGICFMLLCIWLGLLAYNSKPGTKQTVLLASSGLSFILCVGCRPSVAMGALILAPFFISILANREYKLKSKAICACSFILPIVIGGAGLMWYNYARFGSPFDFGMEYQLTVSNIGANSLRLSDLPGAIIHYFLHPFAFTSDFPFFTVQTMSLNNYGHYVYNDNFFGVINFPCVFIAFITAIYILVHDRKKQRRLTKNNNLRYFTYMAIVVISVFTAWSDFCLAGVAFGYMLDILPLLSVLAILIYLDIQSRLFQYPQVQSKVTAVFASLMVLTVVIVSLHLLIYSDQNLFITFPNIKNVVEDLVVFWR